MREAPYLRADDHRALTYTPARIIQAAAAKRIETPRILLTATLRWPVAARLAMAFRRLGCHVDALCPKEHPVARLRECPALYHYGVLNPLGSLNAAIKAASPDLIIPCDDDAALHLNLLYERVQAGAVAQGYAHLIERSLGTPSACRLSTVRAEMGGLALREGVRTPATQTLLSEADLDVWSGRHDYPTVLKIDNTWGGLGVYIARNKDEARRAFNIMSVRPPLLKAVIRTALDRDSSQMLRWLKHPRRSVTAQDHVNGIPANRAVACWRGRILAGISVEALSTQHPTGPATVVRIIEHTEMSDTAARLVRRLGLSGLWGFDFVLDSANRAAWLIEVNPRATPICHLALGIGCDLPAALCSQLTGSAVASRDSLADAEVIAMFPGEWRRSSTSKALHSVYHDIPWEEPGLLQDGLGLRWEDRGLLARLKNGLQLRHLRDPAEEVAMFGDRTTSIR